uniref:Uncharacterized protein n=1 Tax=Monopterus albus TaxID=43700 RepID=A0A3Q3J6N4_MONAL
MFTYCLFVHTLSVACVGCLECTQTCKKFAVLLLCLLCTFKLFLGMFLRYFVPQINRIFLLPVTNKKGESLRSENLRYESKTSDHILGEKSKNQSQI